VPHTTTPATPGPAYRLAFADEFDGAGLDADRWLPQYLPHWTQPGLSVPRYQVGDGCLTLRIDADQPPWCPEYDGAVKCSLLQTGHFAGPLGSAVGQHRFRDGMVVRSEVPSRRFYVPRHAYIEMRARADIGPSNLVSLYMLGFEQQPAHSGEITIMEVFGTGLGPDGTRLGHGIKPIHDPLLRQEFRDRPLPFDLADWHIYAAEWTALGVSFYLDGALLDRTAQSPGYAMQLMLGLYELPGVNGPRRTAPATFSIDYLHAHERV
jgi:Glycosyl hydrolases family 16